MATIEMNTLRSHCPDRALVQWSRLLSAACLRLRRRHPLLVVVATAALIVSGSGPWSDGHGLGDRAALAYTPQPARITEGVYTAAQAERGMAAYAKGCTYCHRADLSGNEDGAPALSGDAFANRWKDRLLSELYFVIQETMPQDEPRSLSAVDCVDVVAYILSRNGASPGSKELTADPSVLTNIPFSAVVP